MDVLYRFRGQQFIWDSRKAIENRAKHGVRFETGCEVFFDRLVTYLNAGVAEEERQTAIGLSEAFELLYVVHLEREDEFIRIVSVRAATAKEKRTYENGG